MQKSDSGTEEQVSNSELRSQVTIIIPTLNESATIQELIERLLELYPGIKILVCDDVSSDGTQNLVRQFSQGDLPAESEVSLLERINAEARGITASVLDGLGRVQSEYFAVMDGDLQHPPQILEQLLVELEQGADFVVAARLPFKENQGLHRILMTRFATKIAKLWLRVHGVSVADPMSGFFAGRTQLAVQTAAESRSRFELKGYKICFDLLRLIKQPIELRQVFYQFGMRPGGHSKMRPAHALYFLRSLFR